MAAAGGRRHAIGALVALAGALALGLLLSTRDRSEARELQAAAEAMRQFVDGTFESVAPEVTLELLDGSGRQGCGSETPDDRIDYWVRVQLSTPAEAAQLRDEVIAYWRGLDLVSNFEASNGDLEIDTDEGFGAYVGRTANEPEMDVRASTDCFHP